MTTASASASASSLASSGSKLRRKQEELRERQRQQQQHLPLSTLCRSAALKLRRAAMVALPRAAAAAAGRAEAVASRVAHLTLFVSIVETGVMAHPQFRRRVAGGGEDAELIAGVVDKLDGVREELHELVGEMGFEDHEAYLAAHAPAARGAAPGGRRGREGARSRAPPAPAAAAPRLVSGPIMEASPPVAREAAAAATTPPAAPAVSADEYRSLLSANTEMKEQQRRQRGEIQELQRALRAMQSQSFVSPLQVMRREADAAGPAAPADASPGALTGADALSVSPMMDYGASPPLPARACVRRSRGRLTRRGPAVRARGRGPRGL